MSKATKKSKSDENNEVSLEEALKLAQAHHHAGNFVLAERTYRDILRSIPDHSPTTHFLGILLFQTANVNEAKHFLKLAVDAEPFNAHCLNNYAGALTQLEEYEEALTYFDKALDIDPLYLDALNNKSNAQWKTDDFKGAEETAKRALDVDAKNIAALNNLGITLAKQSRFEEAQEVWDKASEISPEDPTIYSNAGNALRDMGKLKAAEEKCRKALEINPKNPEALNNLGNILRDRGQSEQAIEYYEQATNIQPSYYVAHSNKSIAYTDRVQFEEAAIAARYAIAFKDDFVDGYSNLSRALCELGEYIEAHAAAQRIIQLDPDKPEGYLEMADVLIALEQFYDAEATMDEALKREPDSARAYIRLSEIRERLHNFEGAIEAVDKAIELNPKLPATYMHKATVLQMMSQLEEGIEELDKALQISPNLPGASNQKAEFLISLNRNDEAEAIVREMIEKNKKSPAPYITLSSLKKFKSEDDPDFVLMKEAEKVIGTRAAYPQASFYYALSDVYEQMKNYDKAFEYLEKANDIKATMLPHKAKSDEQVVNAIMAKYSPAFFQAVEGEGHDSDVPVFILGMPRSGTTLTEQIISSHPDVYPAGELPEVPQVHKRAQIEDGVTLEELGKDYVERLKKHVRGDAKPKRVTDKMPANYNYVGFIKSILPNAKIVHCRRNPIDTCLSCYKQNFARGQAWSYNLEDMAAQYKTYLEVVAHWREVMGDHWLEVDYEETVGNFEEQARKLIDFVGLEWDDACLEPHKQKRAVLTASKAQVTKPVYKTSVEKWRRYEKYLQPLVRELMPDQALPEEKS